MQQLCLKALFALFPLHNDNIPIKNMHCGSTKCSPTQYAPFSSILCTLHTQYASRGAYCVGSVHMLFQWSSEGTQYALYLTNLMSKAMPAS